MSDDYLWDRSGQPDPEVDRLEGLLSPFRHKGSADDVPIGSLRNAQPKGLRRLGRRFWLPVVATAAAIVLCVVTWLALRPTGAYEVVTLEGRPRIGLHAVEAEGKMGVGEWLVTDGASRAKIKVGLIGEVDIEPNTRVRLLRARPNEHRLGLARGVMNAAIWAPPRLFYVDTPSAVAVDLGCTYTLEVDDEGAGTLRVTSGWVAFELAGRESFVPAGATCITRPRIGPGTPFFDSATERFRAALSRMDFETLDAKSRAEVLSTVLAEARREDALTLWHLLLRSSNQGREQVFDRMAELVPPPPGVTRDGVLKGNRPMLDQWWDQLGLEDMKWWQLWKWPAK